jgi:hypothetical protein
MRRALTSTLSALFLVGLFGAGCPIWIDDGGNGWGPSPYCGYEGCLCDGNWDCSPGLSCNGGTCTPADSCMYYPCPDGYVCDDRWTCVPEDTVSCDEDTDCAAGYCDLDAGRCVNTGYCVGDEDCAVYGASFVCDDRGLCVPDRGPCPDGTCGCVADDECRDMGPGGEDWLCEAGRCHDPLTLCTYSHECPTSTVCQNSFCRVDCSAGALCPTGQECVAGVCLDDADGGGQCTYSTDCGGGALCVNAYCVSVCSGDTCGAFESCQSGLCLPEVVRLAECSAADCGLDLSCVDGVCREPCVVNTNCADNAPFTVCSGGFCRTPNEVAGGCTRAADCGSGVCFDGACR